MKRLSPAIRTLLLLLCAMASTSCATKKPVPDSQRDTTGRYDGNWIYTVSGRAGIQHAGNTSLDCNRINHQSIITVESGRGTVNLLYGKYNETFNIDTDGKFFIDSLSKSKWSSNNKILVRLHGDFDDNTGSGIYAISAREFVGPGCRYKTLFRRAGWTNN